MQQMNQKIKILHSSDWHIGKTLYGRKRYKEFEDFLDWLMKVIKNELIDVLIIAGDIFDTGTPNNKAQELYYNFLCQVAKSQCKHVVVIAGNHDSPTFLNAPKSLLKYLNVHVVGTASENKADDVLLLKNESDEDILIVCAVPYLRDKDLRFIEAGESIDEKGRKLIEGIKNHYQQIVEIAESYQKESKKHIPIIATGHLFTAGGAVSDGVRDLYVGNLAHVHGSIFSSSIDYLALGHLHIPQKILNTEHMRYSGSPLPMSFSEIEQQKIICIVKFSLTAEKNTQVSTMQIPQFQKMARISGDFQHITNEINILSKNDISIWCEIIYTGNKIISNLKEEIDLLTKNTAIDILRIKNNCILQNTMQKLYPEESLDELSEHEVFNRCLEANKDKISEEQKQILLSSYQEILLSIHENDHKKD